MWLHQTLPPPAFKKLTQVLISMPFWINYQYFLQVYFLKIKDVTI